jgi:hypothetical protein
MSSSKHMKIKERHLLTLYVTTNKVEMSLYSRYKRYRTKCVMSSNSRRYAKYIKSNVKYNATSPSLRD